MDGETIERLNKLLETVTPWKPISKDYFQESPKVDRDATNLRNQDSGHPTAEFSVSNLEGCRSLFYDDVLLVYGGCCGNYFNSSVYVYDINSLIFNKLPSASIHTPKPRAYHSMCEYNGRFIVFGGLLEEDAAKATIEALWEFCIDYSRAPKPSKIDGNCAVSWRRCQSAGHQPPFLNRHTSAIYANRMFILGGISTKSPRTIQDRLTPILSEPLVSEVYSLHLETNVWHMVCTLSVTKTPSFWGHTTVCVNNYLICFGGIGARTASFVEDCYVFDVISLKWIQAHNIVTNCTTNSLTQRTHHSAVVYENKGRSFIVVYGGLSLEGKDWGNAPMLACEVTALNSPNVIFEWYKMESTSPTARALMGHIAHVHQDHMYVFGGYRYSLLESMNYNNIVFIFNLNTLKWNSKYFGDQGIASPTAADFSRNSWHHSHNYHPTCRDTTSKHSISGNSPAKECGNEIEYIDRLLNSYSSSAKMVGYPDTKVAGESNPTDATLLLESLPYYERELAGSAEGNATVISSPGKNLFLQYLNTNDKYFATNLSGHTDHPGRSSVESAQPSIHKGSKARPQEPYHIEREFGGRMNATPKKRPPRPQWGRPNAKPVELGPPFWTVKSGRKRSNSTSSTVSVHSTSSIMNRLRRNSCARGDNDTMMATNQDFSHIDDHGTPVSHKSAKLETPEKDFNISSPISETKYNCPEPSNITESIPRVTPPLKQLMPILAYPPSRIYDTVNQKRMSDEISPTGAN